MASSQPTQNSPRHTRRRPPTYWQCQRAIASLERFKALIIHREHFTGYQDEVPPIDLILPGVTQNGRQRAIDREINRLIPLVGSALDYISISTGITLTDFQPDLEKPGDLAMKKAKQKFDLVNQYFELPRDSGEYRYKLFELVLGTLERGIGAFEECKRHSVRRVFNPVCWLAWIVGLPIRVLETAGVPMEDASSKGVQTVGWVLRLLMLVGVSFAITRLGVSVPWDKIITALK